MRFDYQYFGDYNNSSVIRQISKRSTNWHKICYNRKNSDDQNASKTLK